VEAVAIGPVKAVTMLAAATRAISTAGRDRPTRE